VAITPRRALTALHTNVTIGTEVGLRTTRGIERFGTVVFCSFRPFEVDIAVVELAMGEADFEHTIEIAQHPVRIGQEIRILGLKKNRHDEIGPYFARCEVNYIDPSVESSIIESDYTSHDGLSGAGIITIVEGSRYHVIGVHVASHDETVAPPNQKKPKRTLKETGEDLDSISSGLRGHRAYTMICEAIQVVGLHEFLRA
jgi:hypothetical protein